MDLASGLLEKMELIAYSDEGFSTEVGRVKVQMNPNGYHQNRKHNYTQTPVIGGTEVYRFGNEEAEKQSFEIIFDASLVSLTSIPSDVKTKVDGFIKLIYLVN